jgi:hypothetical protein
MSSSSCFRIFHHLSICNSEHIGFSRLVFCNDSVNGNILLVKDFRYSKNSILTPFRAQFWLEQKQWFVTVKYTRSSSTTKVIVFSPTYSTTKFPAYFNFDEMSYWTTTTKNDNASKMNNECNRLV